MQVSPIGPTTISTCFAFEPDRDGLRIALPRPELHLVARFGPDVPGGLDMHVLGARERVVRKRIRRGQRAAMARLPIGAAESVLGASAASLVGQIVPIEDLWGSGAARRLSDRLAGTTKTMDAAAVLEQAIAERRVTFGPHLKLALDATRRLAEANVGDVATALGVSERHLRRVFHETVGLGPKAYARLARFHRALRAGREVEHASWAAVAAAAGYYDQAHLIAEFRAIAGVTPRALVGELRAAPPVG